MYFTKTYINILDKITDNNCMALNYLELNEISNEIIDKIRGNHIANISLINSSDVILTFSFYRKEKLLISLNHNYPLIGMVDKDISFPTILNKLSDELRKHIKDTIVTDIRCVEKERIIEIILQKTDEFYVKREYFLILELIPHHQNLLILDDNRTILFANRYTSLTDKRIIIKGMKYELPIKQESNKELSVNLEAYRDYLKEYLSTSMSLRLKEKYSKLIDTIKRKIKTATNKTDVLTKEIEEAKTKIVYQEYGTTLLTMKDDKEFIEQYIKDNNVPIDTTKSYIDNANILFKKYKKSKETITRDNEQLELNKELLDKLNNDLSSLNDADESLYLFLASEYLKSPIPKSEVNKLAPFYVTIDGTKIAFGRNAVQNDLLTFKKAQKDNYFFHIKDQAGSHVVILKKNPNDNDKTNASELCLALVNKEAGEVQMAEIRDIKKGQFLGQVLFNHYTVIRINKVKDKIKVALNKVSRINL